MALFVKKITDPEEAYKRLISDNQKVSGPARQEFVASMDHGLVEFLYDKYNEAGDLLEKLAIIETYAAYRKDITEEDMRLILKLVNGADPEVVEALKQVLVGLNETNLMAATELLASTTDQSIHDIIQHGIGESGVLGRILEKWNRFSLKEQVLYIGEIVLIQSPKTYPIFLEIMKEETVVEKQDDKKILQVEFTKHLDKIKSPDFMDLCIKELPAIAASVRYPLFKGMQTHGKIFYEKIFDGLAKKSENLRLASIRLMDQLVDANSYPYLFPFLLDTGKSVPSASAEAIVKIVKGFCEDLEAMGEESRKSKATKEKMDYFVPPLVSCLDDRYSAVSKSITECIIRIGRYDVNVILANLPSIFEQSEIYFRNYLRGLDVSNRKNLLIKACSYPNVETGRTAIKLLSDPSEAYVVETINTILLDHFLEIPEEIQMGLISLMNDPKMQRCSAEIVNHEDPEIRKKIIKILGESGAPNALGIISDKLLDPDVGVRQEIITALQFEHFQTHEGLDLLIRLLDDTEPDIALKALEVLKELDDPRIMVSLTNLIDGGQSNKVRDKAKEVMSSITRRKYIGMFNSMSPESRLAVGRSLIKMDPYFLEDVSRDLSHSDAAVRLLSAQILETLYLEVNADLKTNLIVAIKDPDPKVRSVIVMILGRIGGVAVEGLLVSCLADKDNRVRANTIEALLFVSDISIAEKIVPFLSDTNNRVRGNAIMTLWKIGYYKVYDSIVHMFKSEDKWMRSSVAFAVGELQDIRFLPVLVNNLNDKDPDVRRNVVKALSKTADPYTLAPYIRPLRFDPDEMVRKEVVAALTIK